MRNETCELGFLARPKTGMVPGVVLIHDVWGLEQHTRDLFQRLAREGYQVLGIDLYRRERAADGTVAIEAPAAWILNLSDPRILSDIEAGAAFLRNHPRSLGEKVAVVGFCMGGMYTLLAGCGVPGIDAIVPFYGMLSYSTGLFSSEAGHLDRARKPREPLAAVSDLACPMLAFFGEEDVFISNDQVDLLRWALADSTQPHEIVTYPRAGHAFLNDSRPEAYRPEAAADAWARMLVFLKARLA